MSYIHDLKKWPAFHWNTERLATLLAEVRHRQGHLLGRMAGLGFKLRDEASLQTLTEEVVKSSAIEGEQLDRTQVRSSLARRLGIEAAALTPKDRNVEGIVEVMIDATQRFRAPLTKERLYSWHAALFPSGRSGMQKIRTGKWRNDADGPMQVVSGPIGRQRVHFQAPEAGRLEAEMKVFLKWFDSQEQLDPVLKAGLAHLWCVTLHPFDDGNGRIARAVADMALARSENSPQRFYSMSAQIRAERSDYYKTLEDTQRGGLDITKWLEWFLGCLDRAIQGAEETLQNVLKKEHFWKIRPGEAFNDRQRKMLNQLLDGFEGKLTSSKWAKIAKCSQDTASRDIDDLLKRGILTKNPEGGRSTSYTLKEPARANRGAS